MSESDQDALLEQMERASRRRPRLRRMVIGLLWFAACIVASIALLT
jgi:hypothetical protein